MPGFPGSFRMDTVDIKPTEALKEFWIKNDKCWAWHLFLVGVAVPAILEGVGGNKEDFMEWVAAVCRGEEKCIYSGSIGTVWTKRQEELVRRMYKYRLQWHDACRLLGRFPWVVKLRIKELKPTWNNG